MISCLRRAGVEVVERHEPVWEGRRTAWRAGAGVALRLARAQIRLARRIDGEFDAVVVGYPGHADASAARRAAPGTPLVLNPLVSLADTLVEDRARFARGSLAAGALEAIDRHAFRTADVVVADTRTHAELFSMLGARRVDVCFVGAEDRLFAPGAWRNDEFEALFVGKLIPLHGLETIVRVARSVPDVRFRIVGSGQEARALEALPRNVERVPWIAYEDLPREYRRAGCALGIFGTSAKAARVIPNKVFQALACGTAVITADTPASRELLDDESALLVPPGDADALAEAVRLLASNGELRDRIAAAGLARYRERASEDVLGRCWRSVLERAAA